MDQPRGSPRRWQSLCGTTGWPAGGSGPRNWRACLVHSGNGRWQEGFTITSAPLYYDGLVITEPRVGTEVSGGGSPPTTPAPAARYGDFTPFPVQARLAMKPGLRIRMPGKRAARRSGTRLLSIPHLDSSTSRPAIPGRISTAASGPETIFSLPPSWPSRSKPGNIDGTFKRSTMTCGTMTPPIPLFCLTWRLME